jgi:hypothetical protein
MVRNPSPKLAKCTYLFPNLLIVSYESQIYLNNLLNLLKQHDPCSDEAEPGSSAATARPPRALLRGPLCCCRDGLAPPHHWLSGRGFRCRVAPLGCRVVRPFCGVLWRCRQWGRGGCHRRAPNRHTAATEQDLGPSSRGLSRFSQWTKSIQAPFVAK